MRPLCVTLLSLVILALATAPGLRAEDKDKKKEEEREKKGGDEEKKKKAAMEAAKRREEAEMWADKDCPWPMPPDVERMMAWVKRKAAAAHAAEAHAAEAEPGVAGYKAPPDRDEAQVSRHMPAVFGEGMSDADLSWLDE